MKIIIRKDLKMRKGKTAAQSAHALTKLLLEKMQKNDDHFTISKLDFNHLSKQLDDINNKLDVIFVNSEEELDSLLLNHKSSTSIIDHGRTEFHGVKTKTCAAVDLFDTVSENPLTPNDENRDVFAKQIFVFSKEFKLPEEIAAKLSAIGSLRLLSESIEENNDTLSIDVSNDELALSQWLKGAFAKIGLCVKKDLELIELHHELQRNNIKSKLLQINYNKMLAIEPLFPQEIDPFTKDLKLI